MEKDLYVSLEMEKHYKKTKLPHTRKGLLEILSPDQHCSPPSSQNMEWESLDEKELAVYAAEYNRNVKQLAQKEAADSAYGGGDKCVNNGDLRLVHRMGKHYTVPSRASAHQSQESKGGVKSCCELLSRGVKHVPLNLFVIAGRSAIQQAFGDNQSSARNGNTLFHRNRNSLCSTR